MKLTLIVPFNCVMSIMKIQPIIGSFVLLVFLFLNVSLLSYEIIIHHPCPQVSKPNCETFTDRIKVGSAQKYNVTSLTAYTNYMITIQASNVIGIALSGKLFVLTLPEGKILSFTKILFFQLQI